MKTVRILALALLALALAVALAACGGENDLPATTVAPATIEAPATAAEAELISASDFTIEGAALSLTLPNGTESYSFADKIEVSPGATWQISADPNGMGYSLTKAVSIHDGENDFYLFVISEDGKTVNRYTVSIWCEADWYVVKDGIITGVTASFRANAKNVEIPSELNGTKITGIGRYAFSNCTQLNSVVVPDGITSVGVGAFANCIQLTSVVWNAVDCSLIDEDDAPGIFGGCLSLTTVTIGDRVKSIPQSAFSGCFGLTSVTIGNSVTSIGVYAFTDCSALTSVTIGNGVTSIGDGAFSGCSGLTSITIPGSVTSSGSYAFYNCSGLTSVTIGNGVTSIGNYAFYNCSKLTSVTIPDSVTSIGGYAFNKCTGLTSITYTGTQAQWNAIDIASTWIGTPSWGGLIWTDGPDSYTIHCTDGDLAK